MSLEVCVVLSSVGALFGDWYLSLGGILRYRVLLQDLVGASASGSAACASVRVALSFIGSLLGMNVGVLTSG